MTTVSSNPRGFLVGAFCKALILGAGDPMAARAYAMSQGAAWTPVVDALKNAVNAITTGDATTSLYTAVAFDFAQALRPATLLGRIAGMQRVPFNLRCISIATGGSAYWVGEGKGKPLTLVDFDKTTGLAPTKLASLSVHTQELARSSQPGVEQVLGQDAIAAAAQAADLALVDSGNAGSASRPASVTNGATAVQSTGNTVAQIDADLRAVVAVLSNANVDLSSAVWLLAPRTATYMGSLRGTAGAYCFPGLGPRGGSLLNMPALTSNALMDENSPSESSIALLAASELMVADDGASRIEASMQASVEMVDSTTDGAAQQVSAWQHGLAILRAERTINWRMRHATGCAYVAQVQF